MSYAAYAALDNVNFSSLKFMAVSPAEYRYRKQTPLEATAAMELGRAVHTAVFEPDRLPLEYAVWDTAKGNRNTNAYKDWAAQQGERQILTADDWATCCAIRDAVRAHPVAAALLAQGEAEKTIKWTDKETGLKCKGRLDWLSASALVDLKTASTIGRKQFAASAANFGYFEQAAFYLMGLRANGIEVPASIIAVESKGLHDVGVFGIPEDTLDAAEDKLRNLLTRLAECLESDTWPGQYPQEETLDAPGWYFPDERELAELKIDFGG